MVACSFQAQAKTSPMATFDGGHESKEFTTSGREVAETGSEKTSDVAGPASASLSLAQEPTPRLAAILADGSRKVRARGGFLSTSQSYTRGKSVKLV